MLFKKSVLDRIASGEITIAFRKWKKPTVKSGSQLKTAAGVLSIQSVESIDESATSEKEAIKAGFSSLHELLSDLNQQRDGQLYRISFSLTGADPRLALREDSELSAEDVQHLCERLSKMDASSKVGPWTEKVLKLIAQYPQVRAQAIADASGFEKEWLKTHIRKLKNLGLTISEDIGYRISPRGEALLQRMEK